jgi:phenylalanyl-tRNA synthetase beta chain
MRVPLPWLGEYVDVPAGTTGAEVAAALVRVGLEEEALHGGDVVGPLVVGRVLEFVEEPQKNGKTIRWCQVDVGEHNLDGAPRGIVCGARNFFVGDLVVVVLPGAVLPGPFAITARKTYGHVSDGMICSSRELGLGDDHDGIIRLTTLGLDDVAVGTDAIALLGLDDETVEVNVTPDRGYAFSVRGVARDYAAATGAAFHDPAELEVPAPTADGYPVRLVDDAPLNGVPGCDRYVARVVRGVAASTPSPRWMRRRLEQAGMRPISLAVDVTNYVMLGLGQPLHAFDLHRLQGEIVVRRARPGETLTTLDDVERRLDLQDLLITDADGERVLALAGVMGGAGSEVHAGTTDLLIEAAHFEPITVARTARRHKLVTEAGRRFERGVDDDLPARAAELVVRLLVEHGGGTADVQLGPVTDVDRRRPLEPIVLPVVLSSRVVGLDYTPDQVHQALATIGCRLVGAPGGDPAATLTVLPPSWRPDLRLPVDLVEEVARLVGYDAIPSVLPTAPPGRGLTAAQRRRRSVARALAEHGLVEVLTYPFVSPSVADAFGMPADDARRQALRLANPLSDEQPLMRTNLLSTLLDALRRNVSRGATDAAIFEIGLVTRPGQQPLVAPRLAVGQRPSDADLAAVRAAVPPQPRRVAMAFTGNRLPAGWAGAARAADWTDAVDAAQHVAATLGLRLRVSADEHAPWHPGRCARLELDGVLVGHAGELHPTVLTTLGLPARACAAELDLDLLLAAADQVRAAAPVSTFPLAKEDVALVVDTAVPAGQVEAALRHGGGQLLESVRLFDVYAGPQLGEGKKSLAFALRLRAADRTLTAAETAAVREAAVAEAAARVGAVLRG